MHDPKDSAANATGGTTASTRNADGHASIERLRALRSAWGVLAPSGLADENQSINQTGRELSNGLVELLDGEPSSEDRAKIAALDARLDELEREMRDVALKVPVSQLRSTLPEQVAIDRRGVLDLLDLVLGAETAGLDGTRARIPTLDYLITLLCTGGDPNAPLQDPVTLTPRLHGLCALSAVQLDPRLSEIEDEFHAAADMLAAEIHEEFERRTLRRRKMELGTGFFAPTMLRAIVSYNTSLQRGLDNEEMTSQDWGRFASREAPCEATSVFESTALPKLVEALRRRIDGDAPTPNPLDRVAWCLDLSYLTGPEQEALLSASTGRREDLKGTTILVGLLYRSSVVLDEEFPEIGISPKQLSSTWIREIDEALQQDMNQRIAGDGYGEACVLSDLRGKFLTKAKVGARSVRRPVHAPTAAQREAEKQARQFATEALESLKVKKAPRGLRQFPWGRIAQAGAGGLLALFALALVSTVLWDEGRIDRAELVQMSPFLSAGTRSDAGTGRAFAGTLDEAWSELGAAEQAIAADRLVRALRHRGVRQIMIYDDDRQLRIQAFGSQPARVIPARVAR